MRNTFKSLFVLLLAVSAFAFTPNPTSNNWKLYKEIQGIQIFTKVGNCKLEHTKKSAKYMLFKYVNTTNKNLRITGHVDAYYNGNCRSCGLNSPNEYDFSIDLKAGTTQKGNCSDELKAFKLYYGQTDKENADLSKFELSQLAVATF